MGKLWAVMLIAVGLASVAGAGLVLAGVGTQPAWVQVLNATTVGLLVIGAGLDRWYAVKRKAAEDRVMASAKDWMARGMPGDWTRQG